MLNLKISKELSYSMLLFKLQDDFSGNIQDFCYAIDSSSPWNGRLFVQNCIAEGILYVLVTHPKSPNTVSQRYCIDKDKLETKLLSILSV